MNDIRITRNIRLYFRWFDFWVGVFYNRTFKTVYIQPFPMFGIRIEIVGDK